MSSIKAELLERLRVGAAARWRLPRHPRRDVGRGTGRCGGRSRDRGARGRWSGCADLRVDGSARQHVAPARHGARSRDVAPTVAARGRAADQAARGRESRRVPRQRRAAAQSVGPRAGVASRARRRPHATSPRAGSTAGCAAIERSPGIIDAAVWIGYAWADEPRCGAAVVVTGTDDDAILREARGLAEAYWNARTQFAFSTTAGDADWCIETGLASVDRPFFISDSGDNPTAGGAGDVAFMLESACCRIPISRPEARPRSGRASSIRPRSRAASTAGEGATVDLRVGGVFGSHDGAGTALRGEVRRADVRRSDRRRHRGRRVRRRACRPHQPSQAVPLHP